MSPLEQLNKAKAFAEKAQLPPGEHYVQVNGETLRVLLPKQDDLGILKQRLSFYGMSLV